MHQRPTLAVTLLTGDDLELTKGTKVLKPRDNCIFEAGLFMGALGVDGKRSVLVSSVNEGALPVDLRGVKYLRFPDRTENNSRIRRGATAR